MKKLLCVLLALCTLFFAGCHGKQASADFQMPEGLDTSRQYEITFWAKNDSNKTQQAIYAQAVQDFQALYPFVTVNLRLYSNYGDIYNDVITNIATDTTPNVCITYPDHIATYLTGDNCVVNLETLMDDPRYGLGGSELAFDGPTKEEIIPRFLEEGVLEGGQYALPYMRSTECCYVNKTYVEKLGYTLPETLTWDFIWEVSKAATEKAEDGTFLINGQKVMIPFIYKSTDNMMIQMLYQKNAEYSTSEGEILLFNDTTREILTDVAELTETGAFSTFKISSYPANYLNAGQCIFAIDSTAGATWMGSDAPLLDISEDALVEFETEVMMLPQFDPEQPLMISQGPSVCVFNKTDPQEVLVSWLFTQYLLTNEVQIPYSQTEGYVPVTSKAQNSAEYQDYLQREGQDNELHYTVKLQASKLLMANTENTFVTPVFNGSASLRNAAGQLVENVTKSVRRKQTVDDAYMEKLFSDMESLYRLNQLNGLQSSTDVSQPLPAISVALLVSLVVIWLLMGIYVVCDALRRKKKENK